jgi:hypothetical protein
MTGKHDVKKRDIPRPKHTDKYKAAYGDDLDKKFAKFFN